MSTTIDKENAKRIRKPMEIYVRVEAMIDGDLVVFDFTNDDIISVELNLRSDLSPIDPTLPESEIEVHVYYERDISNIVKKIDDNQPLLYWAGYDGDYSPTRKFYISEPVIWANKELVFKAVDAVHFLDKEIDDIYIGNLYCSTISNPTQNRSLVIDSDTSNAFRMLAACFTYLVNQGVTPYSVEAFPADNSEGKLTGLNHQSIIGGNIRDILANMMNLLHQDYGTGNFRFMSFWLKYVDAGIPTITWTKPTAQWTIYEEDCGDIQRHTGRDIVSINAHNSRLVVSSYSDFNLIGSSPHDSVKVGTVDLTKDTGATLSIDVPTSICALVLQDGDVYYNVKLVLDTLGGPKLNLVKLSQDNIEFGVNAFTQNEWEPWNTYLTNFWNDALTEGAVEQNDTQASFVAYGNAYQITSDATTYTKAGTGTSVTPNNTNWTGFIDAAKYDDTSVHFRLLPDLGFQSILNRSGKTGSFKWKGDPRMQPRDVIEWHNKDGTIGLRTIESINLKHEAGGTIAEITYREGNV